MLHSTCQAKSLWDFSKMFQSSHGFFTRKGFKLLSQTMTGATKSNLRDGRATQITSGLASLSLNLPALTR